MSWISPKTVQITILPFDSCATPLASWWALITAKLLLTVSAESKSWGKNFFPISKSFPTMSRAGTMQRSMISTGSFPSSSNFFVASGEESLKPLQIMLMSELSDSVRFSGNFGVPLRSLSLPSGRDFWGSAVAPLPPATPDGGATIPNALNKIP